MRKRVQLLRASAGVAAVALAIAVAQRGGSPAQAAVTPGVVASSQVQNLINTVRGDSGTYAGLWLDLARNTVYVSAAKAGVSAATVEALTPRAVSGGATMKLVVVHAKYNFARLEAIAGRVLHDKGLRSAARASHATLSQWWPDPKTDKVVIAFTKVTAAERAAVRVEYGTTARVVAAPVAYAAVGKAAEMRKSSPRRVHPNSRTADYFPWYGGDEINGNNGDTCTSGFDWSGNSMTTAGHCGTANWANNGVYVGTTFTQQWGNGRIDMQRMNGSSYWPYVWAGAAGNTAEPVSGSGGVAIGGHYCTEGYRTGQNCTAQVDSIDVCVVETESNGTRVNVCDLDRAESTNLSVLVQPGDSGGPVIVNTSIYSPYAVGTINAATRMGTAPQGSTVLFSDMYMEKKIFGGAPAVGG